MAMTLRISPASRPMAAVAWAAPRSSRPQGRTCRGSKGVAAPALPPPAELLSRPRLAASADGSTPGAGWGTGRRRPSCCRAFCCSPVRAASCCCGPWGRMRCPWCCSPGCRGSDAPVSKDTRRLDSAATAPSSSEGMASAGSASRSGAPRPADGPTPAGPPKALPTKGRFRGVAGGRSGGCMWAGCWMHESGPTGSASRRTGCREQVTLHGES